MNLIRCFIAIEIPKELKSQIDKYIFSLKQISPEIKWIQAKNLHITLKFLGEISNELLIEVQNKLTGISDVSDPFEISLKEIGFFPNQFKPRVIWLGLQNDKKNSIIKIHEWIDKNLESLGFAREKRRFSPHLTIGRIKQTGQYDQLIDYVNQFKFQSITFRINDVVLMKSVLKSSGAEYSKLKFYPLEN